MVKFSDNESEPEKEKASRSVCNVSESMQIEDVRIVPSKLLFKKPFEGKKYLATVFLQNVGRRLCFIRVFSPTSSSVTVNTTKRGKMLCPGMKMALHVKYVVSMSTFVNVSMIPIIINKTEINYSVEIQKSYTELYIQPSLIEFGVIDVGHASSRRKFTLHNSGTQDARFNIDLGPNPLNIAVEPKRGVVEEKSSLQLNVELSILEEGQFSTQFWVICANPICVYVTVQAIMGKIESLHSYSMEKFTFLEFPRTYCGSKSIKTLLLKNNSQMSSQFCLTAEIDGDTFPITEAHKKDKAFRYFSMSPNSGCLHPNDLRPFVFTYEPSASSKLMHNVVIVRINKIYCTGMDTQRYQELPPKTHMPSKASKVSSIFDNVTKTEMDVLKEVMEDEDTEDTDEPVTSPFYTNYVRVVLYGEVEIPSVTAVPDEFHLMMPHPKLVVRVLSLLNNSRYLPIIFKYSKTMYVKVEPDTGFLKPEGRMEVVVTVTPHNFTTIASEIVFLLMCHNRPKIDGELRKVGVVKVPIIIEGKSTRGDDGRVVGIRRSSLRTVGGLRKSTEEDYNTKNRFKCVVLKELPPKIEREHITESLLLSPFQLYSIEIKPRHTFADMVASNSSFVNTVCIRNNNDVGIRIFLKPHKIGNFFFPNGERTYVPARSDLQIEYVCYSGRAGMTYHILDVIVNENHIFETTISIKAQPKRLIFSFTETKFTAEDPPYKYLKISNILNSCIDFLWLDVGDFKIYPEEGTVQPGRKMTCAIMYDPNTCVPQTYQLEIRVHQSTRNINVTIENVLQHQFSFVDKVPFGKVMANSLQHRRVQLINNSNHQLRFNVVSNLENEGIQIYPLSGTVNENGFQTFLFVLKRAKLKYFSFEGILSIGSETLRVMIDGNIIMPKITIEPNFIKFRKIATSSYDIRCVTLKNKSDDAVTLTIDTESFPEIGISEYTNSELINSAERFQLGPNETRQFAVHFQPYLAQTGGVHLPINVNNMPISDIANIRMYLTTIAAKMSVNSWKWNFVYHPYNASKSHCTGMVIIRNLSQSEMKFCIRLNELNEPFSLDNFFGGSIVWVNDTTVTCLLPEGGEFNFSIQFVPVKPGKYELKLPVFIKDDMFRDVHNYLQLSGVYELPQIKTDQSVVHFGCIPLEFTLRKSVKLALLNHSSSCVISVESSDFNLEAEKLPGANKQERILMLVYSPKNVSELNAFINITCSCNSSSVVRCVGAALNCFLSVHSSVRYYHFQTGASFGDEVVISEVLLSMSSHIVLKTEQRSYCDSQLNLPYFPSLNNPYTTYMNDTLIAVEEWLYTQGFCRSVYYKIPETFCQYEVKLSKPNTKVSTTINVPFYNLLSYFCGLKYRHRNILIFRENEHLYEWGYSFYQNMLEALMEIGCLLHHIEPEYLLPYADFIEVKHLMLKQEHIEDYNDFYLISKQYWLDLIVQTYKVIVYEKHGEPLKKCTSKTSSLALHVPQINSKVFSSTDISLLSWLEKHLEAKWDFLTTLEYDQGKRVVEEGTKKEGTKLLNFDTDLKSGLAFAAATLNFCPYLAKYLQSFYVSPYGDAEHYHNACLLISAWEQINMNYIMTPEYLVNPNPVRMIMFTNYLIEFLPALRPTQVLTFRANLSEKAVEEILITNENNRTIQFNLLLFDNENEVFEVEFPNIVVGPSSTRRFKITFYAKYLKKINVTLVLCGEVVKDKSTKSKAYLLEGIPMLNVPQEEHEFKHQIYEFRTLRFYIQSPYHQIATYEVYWTTNLTPNIDELTLHDQARYLKSNSLARLHLYSSSYVSDENGKIFIEGFTCSITHNDRKMWLAFKSSIGDFFVQVFFKLKPSVKEMKLLMVLPLDFETFKCSCINSQPNFENSKCPRMMSLKIPVRNDLMWSTVTDLFIKKASKDEVKFWKSYKDKAVGLNLMKRFLLANRKCITSDMAYIFTKNVKFDVQLQTPGITAQKTLAIEDIIGEEFDTVDLLVHFHCKAESFFISLVSKDKKELRNYSVDVGYCLPNQ